MYQYQELTPLHGANLAQRLNEALAIHTINEN